MGHPRLLLSMVSLISITWVSGKWLTSTAHWKRNWSSFAPLISGWAMMCEPWGESFGRKNEYWGVGGCTSTFRSTKRNRWSTLVYLRQWRSYSTVTKSWSVAVTLGISIVLSTTWWVNLMCPHYRNSGSECFGGIKWLFLYQIADIRSSLDSLPNLRIWAVPLRRSASFRYMAEVVVWIGYCR